MYYDLIASLPHLPSFERASRLPITPLRLAERLRRLRPQHAEQLERAQAVLRWRPPQTTGPTDVGLLSAYTQLVEGTLAKPLRDYASFRLMQQTFLAALRRRSQRREPPEFKSQWGLPPYGHDIRRRWNEADFGLQHVYPWLPLVRERMTAGDAIGLERLLIDLNWRWLTRLAEADMFGFQAVIAYVFKWDMLQAWLAGDSDRARLRFTALIDKVTHYEQV